MIFGLIIEHRVSPLNQEAEANEANEGRLGRRVAAATDRGGERPCVDGRLAGSVCPLSAADRLSSRAPSILLTLSSTSPPLTLLSPEGVGGALTSPPSACSAGCLGRTATC